MANISDGMEDLGSLPSRIKAIRNRKTGFVITQEDINREGVREGEEDPWTYHVRLAYNHSADQELLEYDPRTESPKGKHKAEDESSVPTLEDGSPITAAALEKLHWQTLRATARNYNFNPDGKSKKAIIEGTLKAAYEDAGLPVPAITE